jgi:hypothetical protein
MERSSSSVLDTVMPKHGVVLTTCTVRNVRCSGWLSG